MWVEICSDSKEDWKETLALFGESFKNSAPFLLPGRTEEERGKFTHEYFKYIYEVRIELTMLVLRIICPPVVSDVARAYLHDGRMTPNG